MNDFDFRHNHYTRDERPHDCPACRIKQLEANVEELEKVAKEWMEDYQRLKDKYEPEVLADSPAVPTKESLAQERVFPEYENTRKVKVMTEEEFIKKMMKKNHSKMSIDILRALYKVLKK